MEKQLCINRLPVPADVLAIIKDFTFYDRVQYTALQQKSVILHFINYTPYSYKDIRPHTRFKFWIQSDPGCNQYQMTFCKKCGDYVFLQTDPTKKIMCKC
jgi:hypothetical protein